MCIGSILLYITMDERKRIMAIVDVLKFDSDASIFAWKYPNSELATWTQLIVNESQEAVLMKNGQIADVFGPGHYTLTTDNIPILQKFINIPFDDRNDELLRIWQQLIASYSKDKIVVDSVLQFVGTSNDLSSLELDYKKLDLLFSFLKSIDTQNEEYFKRVTELKEDIAMKLIKELKKKKNIFKHCNVCGKKLPWNYEYGMCQKCYQKQRRWYYEDEYMW